MQEAAFLASRGHMGGELGRAFAGLEAFSGSRTAKWLSGLEGPALALWCLDRVRERKRLTWVVLPSDREVQSLFSDLESLKASERVELFPETGVFPYEDLNPSPEICRQRVRVLDLVSRKQAALIVSSYKAISGLTIPPKRMESLRQVWQVDRGPGYRDVLTALANRRYVQVDQVRDPGEYAMRGEIIDFFSPAHDQPIRLTYFDETLEEIRFFDGETQRTVKPCAAAVVLPISEWNLEEEEASAWCDAHGGASFDEIRRRLKDNIHFPGIQNYTAHLHDGAGPAWTFVTADMELLLVHPDQLEKTSEILLRELDESRRRLTGKKAAVTEPETLHPPYRLSPLPARGLPLHAIREVMDGTGAMFHLPPPVNYRARVADFIAESKARVDAGWRIWVTTTYPEQAKRLGELLKDLDPTVWHRDVIEEKDKAPPVPSPESAEPGSRGRGKADGPAGDGSDSLSPGVHVVEWTLSSGLVFEEARIAVVVDHELFGRKKRTHRHYRGDDPARILESFIDLKEGDHVVHVNHGIGIYRGLHRRAVDGREKDYLKVEYLENAALYIPVEQVNLIQKYIGAQGRVSIDALGGKAWDKVKSRVKKAVADIAAELIGIYAARRARTKAPYPPDSPWQYEFETAFAYEETPDQLKTIEAIKKDMESERPMDRLVCGDVGFGKTEVAMRGVFKAVLASRQAAVLVPTTILSEQHLHNFRERFRQYPVRVEAINRFRSVTEVRQILRDVHDGKVDVLIGTHRLLSKDVVFKDLGLLVVDEEQKFGVKHKEAIRERAALVDTLTLSATPIPRTLHLSLISIRDISVINTPPADRMPVETWLSEFDEDILIQAILRETGRGGQVYFVHNHIDGILSIAEYLRGLFPKLRVEVGHGQMEEHVLEGVMDRFIRRETDILVCTTIIDSGLDLANANTIFVNHVEHFGLSQLYQLRGRVGRSERQGYAYFFHPKNKSLPELAQKRLQAIVDFVELGSGLKVAMRDLELRGAGNVLGAEQSGDVMAVGFEMYCQLLDEAVQEKMGEAPARPPETALDLKYHGYIPDQYIPDPRNKIEVYKRIGAIRSEAEIESVVAEIEDRFGRMPELIHKLVALSRLRVQATALRVVSVLEKPGRIELTFSAESRLNPAAIMALLSDPAAELQVVPNRPEMLAIPVENTARDERDQTPFEEKIARVARVLKRLDPANPPPAPAKPSHPPAPVGRHGKIPGRKM